MILFLRHTLCFLIVFVMTSCSSPEADSTHSFRTYEEDGVMISENHGGPKYDGELFTYEPILTLQQDETIEESLLAASTFAIRTGSGQYAVLDAARFEKRIVLYDENGRFLRTFGRMGYGPGEFITMEFQRFTREVIHIYDWNQRRLVLFNLDGTLLESIQPPSSFTGIASNIYKTEADQLIIIQLDFVASESTRARFSVYDSEGNVMAEYEGPEVKTGDMMDQGGGFMMPTYIPYAPTPMFSYRPDKGVLVNPGMEPELQWYNLQGELIERIRVLNLDLSTSDDDYERLKTVWKERLESIPEEARADYHRTGDRMAALMPEQKPPWSYVAVDDAGYYWLRVQDPVDFGGEFRFSFHILSPDGEYLGITKTPPYKWRTMNIQQLIFPISVSQSTFIGRTQDEETGEIVFQVYRISSNVRELNYPSLILPQ